MSPQAIQQEQQNAQAFEAAQADNAQNTAHYPWLTDIAPPIPRQNGFDVQVFGQGKGREDQDSINQLNGVYKSWCARNDTRTHFSLVLRWNKKGIRQYCEGKIFNNVVYEFKAASSEQGKKTETTNDPHSYLGRSLLQVCARAAMHARVFMQSNPYSLRFRY